jgi:hypothetical protein
LALEALEDRTVPSLFNAPLIANLPANPDGVATGHLRGPNAPLDAVTANLNGTVSVLLGNGDGSFQSPVNLPVFASTSSIQSLAVGDLLGNGRQDIVVSNGSTVQVLLGNGDGTFGAPQTVETAPFGVGDVRLGDFLGNGRQDILTAEHGRVRVLLSNADGTFQAPIDTAISGVESNHINQVAVGDFNHDGKAGLAIGASNGIEVFRGNGDGTFALENTISLGTATIDPFFTGHPFQVPIGASEVRTADLLGNGQTDIVAVTSDEHFSSPDSDVRVVLGNGDGTFQDAVTLRPPGVIAFPTEGAFDIVDHVVVGDFTGHGDGKLDIATSNFGTSLASPSFINAPNFDIWVNNGDGTFHNLGAKAVGGQQFIESAGDFRGTGKFDLLALGNKSATVFLNNGDGTFNFAPTFTTTADPAALVKADFSGSGRPQDLAVAGPGGTVSVLLGNGDGTFRASATISPPASLGAPSLDGLAVGDFLGNGEQDIAVAVTDIYNGQNSVFIFLGNGNGTFQQTPLTLALPGNVTILSLTASDLNGDGKSDLIVTSNQFNSLQSTGVVSVFLSNGDGTFQAPENFIVGSAAGEMVVADVRGNGKLDLVTNVPAAGHQSSVVLLLGNGDGTFQNPVTVFTGLGDHLAVGNFLGSGRQDVLTYTTTGTLNLLVSNGDGTFQGPITTTTGVTLGTAAVGDFVGNGHLGVAFTATDAGGVVILTGNGDGTFQNAGSFLTGPRGPSGLVAGDFNGDGKLDLIVGDSEIGGFGTAGITVLLNQGNNTTVTGAPTLQGVVLNDGNTIAPVTSLTATLGPGITLDPGAIRLQGPGGSISVNVATSVVGGNTVATVTFPGLPGGALPAGSYTLTVVGSLTHNSQGQTFSADATANFTAEDIVPDVVSVMVNDGSTPDAPVTGLTVTFNEVVSLDPASFALLASDGTPVDVQVTSSVVNGRTVAVLSFGAALADGSYALTIQATGVQDSRNHTLATDFEADFTVSGGLVAGDGILFQLPE